MTDLEFGLIYIFVQNMKIFVKIIPKKEREPPCKNVMHFHMKQLFVSNCVHYTFHTVFIMSVNGVGFFYICLRQPQPYSGCRMRGGGGGRGVQKALYHLFLFNSKVKVGTNPQNVLYFSFTVLQHCCKISSSYLAPVASY